MRGGDAMSRARDDRSLDQLREAWWDLPKGVRREVLRGIREHGRCDGDWRGRSDLRAACALAAKVLS